MIITVQPQKCRNTAEELGDSVKILNHTTAILMEAVSELRQSKDESVRIIARKIEKTAESLNDTSQSAGMAYAALNKIERLYTKTEENIQSKEDEMDRVGYFKVYPGTAPKHPMMIMKPCIGFSPEQWREMLNPREVGEFVTYSNEEIGRFESYTNVEFRMVSARIDSSKIRTIDMGRAMTDMFEKF